MAYKHCVMIVLMLIQHYSNVLELFPSLAIGVRVSLVLWVLGGPWVAAPGLTGVKIPAVQISVTLAMLHFGLME